MSADRALLPATDPWELLDRECGRVEDFLATLVDGGDSDPGWGLPTRCSGWDVRALFAHLRAVEAYNQACLDGTVGELIATLGATDLDGVNDAGVKKYAAVPVADLFAEWRELNADFRARMRERGDGVVDSSVGDYPSLQQSYYLAVEYAAHGDDLGLVSGYEGRDAWRAAFTRFALAEQGSVLSLTPADGFTLVGFEDRGYEVSDADLAEAAVARLPAAHPLPQGLRQALRCCA